MISFKDIELQDKELITSYTQNSPRRNCDLSFSNLCSWRFLYNTKFAIMDGFLLLKFWANDELVYMMPIGNGDLTKVLDALVEDAHREGEPFCLLGICSGMCSELEAFMPGNSSSQQTGTMPITSICVQTSPRLPERNSSPNGIMSTNSNAPIITNILPSLPTASRNVWTWKPNGVRPTTATSMKERATNVAHWSTPSTILKNWD